MAEAVDQQVESEVSHQEEEEEGAEEAEEAEEMEQQQGEEKEAEEEEEVRAVFLLKEGGGVLCLPCLLLIMCYCLCCSLKRHVRRSPVHFT